MGFLTSILPLSYPTASIFPSLLNLHTLMGDVDVVVAVPDLLSSLEAKS